MNEPKILVPIAHGTEETEAVTIIDLLRRANYSVTVAGSDKICTCSRGVQIIADITLDEIEDYSYFDAIILPGGAQGVDILSKNQKLINSLIEHNRSGKLIGAICAAPLILKEAGLIVHDTIVTSHPSIQTAFNVDTYSTNNFEIYQNIITSRALGTAIDFSLIIIKQLSGIELAKKISNEIIYKSEVL